MAFLRRKSGVYHEDVYQEDFEPQRRRRLSKPLTNSSYTNLSSLSTQQMTRQRSRSKTAQETSAPETPVSPNESREALRTYLFTSTSEVDLATPKPKRSTVALMTARFETNAQASTSQLSLTSPTLPQRPMSLMLSTRRALDSHKSSISSLASKDRFGDVDLGTVSPASSTEELTPNPAPRARRTASFTPGMATRTVSLLTDKIHEETESVVSAAEVASSQKLCERIPQLNAEESSDTLPQNDRSGTPTDLEYPNIGGLGLGSLRVVNGASSPGPSEIPRVGKSLLLAIRRDTSSVYAESEIGTIKSRKSVKSVWEDEPLSSLAADDSGKDKLDIYRAFSFKPGAEARFNRSERRFSTPQKPTERSSVIVEEDQTRMMAQDYMEGLPTSPFAAASPPNSTHLPNTGAHADIDLATASPPIPTSQIGGVESRHDNTDGGMESPRSEGSIRRHKDKAHSRRSFIDEALGSSPVLHPPGSPTSLRGAERSGSPVSFFSVPGSDNELEEQFKSAVELQPERPRSTSPRKQQPQKSPLKEALPQLGASNCKSDSGYSSNTSLSTILPSVESSNYADLKAPAEKEIRRGLKFPFRKAAQKSGKPLLVKPTPSTKVPPPTCATIESASALTSTTSFDPTAEAACKDSAINPPTSTRKAKEKPRKRLQKLRRKSTADAAGELVIQRLASVECFSVPRVSNTARSNLAQRSETVPELERTYKTQDHTAEDVNASTLSLGPVTKDVRFPSPAPVEEQRGGRSRSQSRARKRSMSRPRSWFGRPNQEKEESQKKSTMSDNIRLDISDLGSVADLLGDNPYDMARTKPQTTIPSSLWNTRPDLMQRRTSPSNITTNAPRPRSMMDDQAASKLSKARRSASADRGPQSISRQSFDDRGGIPGKFLHQASLSIEDAPPLPPMPTPDEINRRFSYRHGYATHPSPLPYDTQQYPKSVPVDERNDAPPPPPHSPRPLYIEDEQAKEQDSSLDDVSLSARPSPKLQAVGCYEKYNQAIDDDEPPPPPCHSPRPMDITHEDYLAASRDVSWSAHESAWRARRLSVGEALRDSWGQVEQYSSRVQQQPPHQEESAYAVQRRKPVSGQMYQHAHDHQWRDVCYQEQGYFPNPWHPNQPASAQIDVHSQQAWDYGYEIDEYTHNQYAQAVSDPYVVYGNNLPQSMDYSHYHYCQQEPRMRPNYGAWKLPSHPSNGPSHRTKFSHDFRQEPPTHEVPQPHFQPRPCTDHDSRRPISWRSAHSGSNPRCATSHCSRKSLAEELHPEVFDSPPTPSHLSRTQSPHIGRYSGGLEYNYDNSSRGFDGSAGTRSASTAKRNDVERDGRKRSSWLDMQAYGVDLADVPVMSVPVGATGSRMIYH